MWMIHVTASCLSHCSIVHITGGRLIQSVRGQYVIDWRHTCEWFMWLRHVSHTAASCIFLMDDSSKVFVGNMWKIHVTYVNDSCDCVMSLTLEHRAYFWWTTHPKCSWAICERFMSHMCEWFMWQRYVSHTAASCIFLVDDSSKVFVGNMWMIHVTYVWKIHVTYVWKIHVTHLKVSSLSHCSIAHIPGRWLVQSVRGPNMKDSCHIYKRVTWQSHVSHTTASRIFLVDDSSKVFVGKMEGESQYPSYAALCTFFFFGSICVMTRQMEGKRQRPSCAALCTFSLLVFALICVMTRQMEVQSQCSSYAVLCSFFPKNVCHDSHNGRRKL